MRFEKAMRYYKGCGFQNLEVPWFISEKAINATRPEGARLFNTPFGYLPASAEQSFIDMMLQDKLPHGQYQTLTPCFRDDNLDEWHLNAFMKLELIDTRPSADYLEIMRWAQFCLGKWLIPIDGPKVDVVQIGPHEHDLVIDGIEIGSYGKREFNGFTWAYGTGLAEPRFTMAWKRFKDLRT